MFPDDSLKLGRKAVKTDSRTLRLAKYFTPQLPPPPPERVWSGGLTNWQMFMNDELGCCTIAAIPHGIMGWTLNASTCATFNDKQVVGYYTAWDGYNPADPSTDQGGICLDVLKNWKSQGFAGHQINAFATVLPANQAHVMQAINLFGGLYCGVSLPLTAQDQVGGLWDVVPGNGPQSVGGTWGGHCVWVIDYDATGLTCITWGALQKMTWAYWYAYFDEAYAVISPDWVKATGVAPNGFELADLEADVAQIN